MKDKLDISKIGKGDRMWISVESELPNIKMQVEICSHQFWGIAQYTIDRGFINSYVLYGPYEDVEAYGDQECTNIEIMYWRPLCMYPHNGTRGIDSPLMKKFFEKDLSK